MMNMEKCLQTHPMQAVQRLFVRHTGLYTVDQSIYNYAFLTPIDRCGHGVGIVEDLLRNTEAVHTAEVVHSGHGGRWL